MSDLGIGASLDELSPVPKPPVEKVANQTPPTGQMPVGRNPPSANERTHSYLRHPPPKADIAAALHASAILAFSHTLVNLYIFTATTRSTRPWKKSGLVYEEIEI